MSLRSELNEKQVRNFSRDWPVAFLLRDATRRPFASMVGLRKSASHFRTGSSSLQGRLAQLEQDRESTSEQWQAMYQSEVSSVMGAGKVAVEIERERKLKAVEGLLAASDEAAVKHKEELQAMELAFSRQREEIEALRMMQRCWEPHYAPPWQLPSQRLAVRVCLTTVSYGYLPFAALRCRRRSKRSHGWRRITGRTSEG